MSNFISPSVKISEKDNVNYNVNISNNIAIFVGEFEKGPIETPILITDVLQFKLIFGRATESNYNQWYQVFNFLQYSNNIFVCRVSGKTNIAASNNGNIANSYGDWGNIITVEIYKSTDYLINNLNNYFDEYEKDKKYLVLVKRLDKVVESFSVNEKSEIKSNYLADINLEYGIYKLSGGYSEKANSQDYKRAYSLFSKENYEIDIIIADEDNNDLAINLAEERQDCIAFLGLPRKFIDTIDTNGMILTTENDVIIYLGMTEIKYLIKESEYKLIQTYLNLLPRSSYAFFTLGFAIIEDGFNNKKRIINLNADVAGLKSAYSAKNSWLPSAGVERGKVIHESTTIILKQDYSDDLYKEGVNTFKQNILSTQKLFINKPNLIDRLHSRNILNYVKRRCEKLLNKHIFNLNNRQVRGSIATELKMILEEILSSGGIEYGKVYVKEGNEPNSILINITIKIPFVIERININITNVGNNLITDIIGG